MVDIDNISLNFTSEVEDDTYRLNTETYFSGNYEDLKNKPVLATVANSGDYEDLNNKPVLATVAKSGAYSSLTGIPSSFKPTSHTDLMGLYGMATDVYYGHVKKAYTAPSKFDGDDYVPTGKTFKYYRTENVYSGSPTSFIDITNFVNKQSEFDDFHFFVVSIIHPDYYTMVDIFLSNFNVLNNTQIVAGYANGYEYAVRSDGETIGIAGGNWMICKATATRIGVTVW